MANTSAYLIPLADIEVETVVNKSRFICAIRHCQDNQQVKQFIEENRLKYPDASHHCYAFVSSRPDNSQAYGFSDDGEPSGTAGRPMFAALQGSSIGEICAVVTRYFGGTKLGTGGLQRAYGLSVREALLELQTQLKTPTESVNLRCNYNQVKDIEHVIESFSGVISKQEFTDLISLTISLPIVDIKPFCQRVFDLTSGQVKVNTPNSID